MKQIITLVFAGIIGGLITLGGLRLMMPSLLIPTSQTEATVKKQFVNNTFSKSALAASALDFTYAAEKAMPAVVHITATETARTSRQQQQPQVDDLFKHFFGDDFSDFFGGGGQRGLRQGTGSGVILSRDGYIVTNNHVIDFANEVEVTLHDKRKYKAKIIGTDPTTDLAVLKIEANNLPTLKMADSDKTKVGEWVLAVGNPFNLNSTVTAGIVSAKGRSLDMLQGASIESFIQTDAAVNPGNSGGALIDTDGNLVGINTAIASKTGYFSGYSFAIPVNMVTKIVEDLIEYGSAQRGFLGVNIIEVNAEIANEFELKVSQGVYIESLTDKGAAIRSDLQPGDVIVGVNNRNVRNSSELLEMLGRSRPGDDVLIKVNRFGTEKNVRVRLKNTAG